MSRVYRVNSPDVVGEVIDGEAVIVNLSNGSYYSLDGVGALIWALLASGRSVGQTAAEVQFRLSGDPAEIERSIDHLIDELCAEELISEAQGEAVDAGPADIDASFAAGGEFVTPILNKYTDMEDLLLVDPVHGNIIRVEAGATER